MEMGAYNPTIEGQKQTDPWNLWASKTSENE